MDQKQQLSDLSSALDEAQGAIAEQSEFINRIKQSALKVGVVVLVQAAADSDGFKRVLLSGPDGIVAVIQPDPPVAVGQSVLTSTQSGQVAQTSMIPPTGSLAIFVTEVGNFTAEIDEDGRRRVVYNTLHGCESGDRVVLDKSGAAIIQNLGQSQKQAFFTNTETVHWDAIGGLELAKAELREAIVAPYVNSAVHAHYNKRPVRGILLYGPPGCGKSMLAKAAATELAARAGSGAPTGFIYVKGPEILTPYVGQAEQNVRAMFDQARAHKLAHGVPAVIFIDEADAILSKRGTGISSDMEKTVVPAFLAEMDGLEDSGAIVLLVTNRADQLDPAIVRDGRIDRKIRVGRPNVSSATAIFTSALAKIPVVDVSKEELATASANSLFSMERGLYAIGTTGGQYVFSLGNLVNGAMVAGVVDQAVSYAIARDVEAGVVTGLRSEDMFRAINRIQEQQADVNHTDELQSFASERGEKIVTVVPVV